MKREWITGIVFGLAVSIILSLFAPLAQAGPQLICWPFDIGAARSLPWGGTGWHDAQADYDVSRLAADTLALLTLDALVLTRMETLRRAAIYAERDSRAAQELLSKLQARADAAKSDALALFDLGYFAEAYRQTGMMRNSSPPTGVSKINGYELVQRALALRGSDGQMEFAAALVASAVGRRDAVNGHLAQAAANADDGSLLGKNLMSHAHLFQIRAGTLAEFRSQLVAAKTN